MKHLGGPARRAGGKVAGFDHRHFQPTGGGIQRGPRTHHAAAYDHDVELFAAAARPPWRAVRVLYTNPAGSVAARYANRVAHGTGLLSVTRQ